MIDGIDGSGKATQAKILAERLKQAGFSAVISDFPQYNTKSAGLVEEYLSGKYGSAEEVGPYRASMFYACDRYDASFKIRRMLNAGKIVISNRYVAANMGHQGGKIHDTMEKKYFFDWLNELEYEIFNIPKPDLNIILHVPAEISQSLARQRQNPDWVGETSDIHQDDLEHLKNAEKTYMEIAKNFPDFTVIECAAGGQMLSRGKINDLIWEKIKKLLEPHARGLDSENFSAKAENAIRLKIEKISASAKLPTRAYAHDAGFDLYAADYYSLAPGGFAVISAGVKIAVPAGYAGLIWDKGGIAKSGVHSMAGVIDSGFRGEITVELVNLSDDVYHISPGQKIAQLLIQKIETPEIIEGLVDDETDRGDGRFGSSGLF